MNHEDVMTGDEDVRNGDKIERIEDANAVVPEIGEEEDSNEEDAETIGMAVVEVIAVTVEDLMEGTGVTPVMTGGNHQQTDRVTEVRPENGDL